MILIPDFIITIKQMHEIRILFSVQDTCINILVIFFNPTVLKGPKQGVEQITRNNIPFQNIYIYIYYYNGMLFLVN